MRVSLAAQHALVSGQLAAWWRGIQPPTPMGTQWQSCQHPGMIVVHAGCRTAVTACSRWLVLGSRSCRGSSMSMCSSLTGPAPATCLKFKPSTLRLFSGCGPTASLYKGICHDMQQQQQQQQEAVEDPPGDMQLKKDCPPALGMLMQPGPLRHPSGCQLSPHPLLHPQP